MAGVSDSVNLQDNVSPVLQNIILAMNSTMTALEQIQTQFDKPIGGGAMEAARAQIQNLNRSLEQMCSDTTQTNTETDKFGRKMGETASAADKLRNTISQQEKTLSQLKEKYSSLVISQENTTDESRELAGQIGTLSRELNVNKEALDKAQKAADKLAGEYRETGNSGETAAQGIGSAADSINSLLVAAGGYKVLGFIKDSFIEASGAAMEFESAIAGIYKTVDGTPAQLQGLSAAVKAMALEIPSSTTEIAGVMESAGQLGIATDSIEDFARTMIGLGNATNLTSEAAASSLAKFANVTKMDPSQYSNLGSAIVDLGNNFATTEADIVNMSSYLASAASLAGFSQQDILGLSTAMSSLGITAEAGGSSMSRLITQIQLAVETGDGLEDFASVADMSMSQFADTFRNNGVDALQAFIIGLNDVERNGASASQILKDMDLDDIRLSNAIKSLASGSGVLTDAVNTANRAWQENTALTNEVGKRYGTLESKMQITKNAANNLKIAVGNTLNPALESLSGLATDALESLTGFAENHPSITAGIMATAGSLGTLVSGFTAIAPAISPAMQIIDKLKEKCTAAGTSFGAMAGKMGLIVGGASLLIGVGTALYTNFSKSKKAVDDYNGTLEQCRNEIEATREKYNAVINAYGEQSEAAKALSDDLELLNKQYEQGGGAAADYAQRIKENEEYLKKFADNYSQSIDKINSAQTNDTILAAQLKYISEKAVKTNSDINTMIFSAQKLNDTYSMNIKVNYETGDIENFSIQNFNKMMFEKYKQQKAETIMQNLYSQEFIDEYYAAVDNYVNELNALNELKDSIKSNGSEFSNTFVNTTTPDFENAEKNLNDFNNKIIGMYQNTGMTPNEAKAAFMDYKKLILDERYKAPKVNDAIEEALTPEDVAGKAFKEYQKQIEDLAKVYAENCESIRKNLDSMFRLFEQAPDFKTPEGLEKALKDTVSLSDAIKGYQSELDYFNEYQRAINELKLYGMDNNIITQLDPAQAVRFANELNDMDTSEAERKINELNELAKKTEEEIDITTRKLGKISVADELEQLRTDAEGKIKELADEMNFEIDARRAAISTMNGYISEIMYAGDKAVTAAEGIAQRISQALSISANVDVAMNYAQSSGRSGTKSQQASGTLWAPEGMTLVGENGPELVYMSGGERVFNNPETRKILEGLSGGNMPPQIYIPKTASEAASISMPDIPSLTISAPAVSEPQRIDNYSHSVRDVNIMINGENIPVTASMDRTAVRQIIEDHAVPIIMKTLEREIFEEGDGSYVY